MDVLVVPFNIFPDQQLSCMVIKLEVEDYLISRHQFFFMKKVEPWVSNWWHTIVDGDVPLGAFCQSARKGNNFFWNHRQIWKLLMEETVWTTKRMVKQFNQEGMSRQWKEKKQLKTIINDKRWSKTHQREHALYHLLCDISCKNMSPGWYNGLYTHLPVYRSDDINEESSIFVKSNKTKNDTLI